MSWNEDKWRRSIKALPRMLPLPEAARRLGKGYIQTCIKLRHFGYKIKDTRGGFKGKRKLTQAIIKNMDWNLSHAANGRKYKVSRERIRQVWNAVGKPRTKYSRQHHTSSFYKQ